MKPFNLKKAKQGEPCVTRDGRKVYFRKDRRAHDPTATEIDSALLQWGIVSDERCFSTSVDGYYFIGIQNELDIVGMWKGRNKLHAEPKLKVAPQHAAAPPLAPSPAVHPLAHLKRDDKVMVRDTVTSEWRRRHISHIAGAAFVFSDGLTSWSSADGYSRTWTFCRLPTAAELEAWGTK